MLHTICWVNSIHLIISLVSTTILLKIKLQQRNLMIDTRPGLYRPGPFFD
jgi:hypothetical protein